MNEETKEIGSGEHGRDVHGRKPGGVRPQKKSDDLVVDLTGISRLNLTDLALLLTAQRNAEQEDKTVWLAGVPLQIWQALRAMGLGGYFKPFPTSGESPD